MIGNTQMWGLILGFVSPLGIAVLQQPGWPSWLRWLVGWACAAVVGLLTVLASGQITHGTTMWTTLVLTVVASQAAYAGWRNGPASAIERATSPASTPAPPAVPAASAGQPPIGESLEPRAAKRLVEQPGPGGDPPQPPQ